MRNLLTALNKQKSIGEEIEKGLEPTYYFTMFTFDNNLNFCLEYLKNKQVLIV